MAKIYKTEICVRTYVYIGVILLLFSSVNASPLKAFNNPLNNRAIELFLLVDENNSHMSVMQLGLMKTALHNIAIELNPPASMPQFGVFFYGATAAVSTVVPYATTTASAFKTKLDLKQYATMQSTPSTLVAALNTADSLCQSSCRTGVPRVTVVISSAPDSQAELTIRQLERNRGMTVVVVGVGPLASTFTLNRLASHPAQHYAISVGSLYELILTAPHIGSVISDVPRLLDININSPLTISSAVVGTYYTVQLNTYAYTSTNDTIIMFATNCANCAVYGSLSEPNPTSANTVSNPKRYNIYAGAGFPNSLFYFRIPKGTGRFYLSFMGNGMASAHILANVFPLPTMMQTSTRDFQATDLSQTIG